MYNELVVQESGAYQDGTYGTFHPGNNKYDITTTRTAMV